MPSSKTIIVISQLFSNPQIADWWRISNISISCHFFLNWHFFWMFSHTPSSFIVRLWYSVIVNLRWHKRLLKIFQFHRESNNTKQPGCGAETVPRRSLASFPGKTEGFVCHTIHGLSPFLFPFSFSLLVVFPSLLFANWITCLMWSISPVSFFLSIHYTSRTRPSMSRGTITSKTVRHRPGSCFFVFVNLQDRNINSAPSAPTLLVSGNIKNIWEYKASSYLHLASGSSSHNTLLL